MSTNKFAMISVIAISEDRDWTLRKAQPAFDEFDSLIISYFESYSKILGQGSIYGSKAGHRFEGTYWSCGAYRWPFLWNYNWHCFLQLLNDSDTTINPWGLWSRVACMEEAHTMKGTCHSARVRCEHDQSWCKRTQQVLGSLWVQSAIWREWKHRHWDKSKPSKRGQC